MTFIGKEYFTMNDIQEKMSEVAEMNHSFHKELIAQLKESGMNYDLRTGDYGNTAVVIFDKDAEEIKAHNFRGDVHPQNIILMNGRYDFHDEINNYMHEANYVAPTGKRTQWDTILMAQDLMAADHKPGSRNYLVVANPETFTVNVVSYDKYTPSMGYAIFESYNERNHFGNDERWYSSDANIFLRDRDITSATEYARAIVTVMEGDLMKKIMSYPGTELFFIGWPTARLSELAKIASEREVESYERDLSDTHDHYRQYSWMIYDKSWEEELKDETDEDFLRFVDKFRRDVEFPKDIHVSNWKRKIILKDKKFQWKNSSDYIATHPFDKSEIISELRTLYRNNKASKYRQLSTKGLGDAFEITYYHGGDTKVNTVIEYHTSSDEETAILKAYLDTVEYHGIEEFAKFIFAHKDFKRAYYDFYCTIGWYFILKDKEVLPYISEHEDECIELIWESLFDTELFPNDNRYEQTASILEYKIK